MGNLKRMATSTNMAFQHEAGTAIECLSVSKNINIFLIWAKFYKIIPFLKYSSKYLRLHLKQIPKTLSKESGVDANGSEILKCGFRIGGGIDQNYMKSPQGYSDNVSHSLSTVLGLFQRHRVL